MQATQGWCSCFLFLPGLLVHICFPDGKEREGGRVRKRRIGTIYLQRKVLTQTFFTFPLRSDLLTYVPTDHTSQLPCLLASAGWGSVQQQQETESVGSTYFPAGLQSGSDETSLQRPQPMSGGPLLWLLLSQGYGAIPLLSCPFWHLPLVYPNPAHTFVNSSFVSLITVFVSAACFLLKLRLTYKRSK